MLAVATGVLCSLMASLGSADHAGRTVRGSLSPLTLNNFVADHMVLAREPLSANVWGNATAGSKVTVSLDGKAVANTVATADGRWRAAIPPQPAGTDHTITVADGSASIEIVDVAFGDVRFLPRQRYAGYCYCVLCNQLTQQPARHHLACGCRCFCAQARAIWSSVSTQL
jgi:hypothetical protein